MRLKSQLLTALLIAFYLVISPAGWAEGTVGVDLNTTASLEELKKQIEAAIKVAEQRTDLNDIDQADLVKSYTVARNALDSAAKYQNREQTFYQIIDEGPSKAQAIASETAKLLNSRSAQLALLKWDTLADAEQALIKVQSANAALDSKLVDTQRLIDELKTRPAKARDQLTETRKILLELGNQLVIIPGTTNPDKLVEAHRVQLQAQRIEHENEIKMLEQELLSHSGQADVLAAERELLQQHLLLGQEKRQIIETFVNEQGQAEARVTEQETKKIEALAVGKHPEILRNAAINTELSQELVKVTERLTNTRERQKQLEAQAVAIEQDFRASKQRLEIAGLSDASGQYMSNERQKLPDLRQYLKGAKRLRARIRKSGIAQLRLDEQLRALDNIEGSATELIQLSNNAALSKKESAMVQSELVALLNDKKQLLERGSAVYTNYLRALNTLDFTHKRLVETSNQYREFIDENLLWIPSTGPADGETLEHLSQAFKWAFSPTNWVKSWWVFVKEISSTPWLTALFVLLIGSLLILGRPLRKAVDGVAMRLQGQYSYRFIYTIQALILTFLIALPLPLMFAFFGWRLGLAEDNLEFAKSLASAFTRIVTPLFLMHMFFAFCKAQGIAAQHLNWDTHLVAILRKNLFWLMLLVIPLLFLAALTKAAVDVTYYSSLGRLSLLVIAIAQSTFIYLVLNPNRGLPKNIFEKNPDGSLMMMRYVWFPILVILPLVVAILALVGYQYTAVMFMELLLKTLWLVLGMIILHDLIVRWLTASNQKLALVMAKEKRNAEKSKVSAEGMPEVVDISNVEFAQLSDQTLGLLRLLFRVITGIGIFIIWADVIPALAFLEDIALWKSTALEGGEEVLYAVTLADIFLAILLGIVVFTAARNLPGVMEMVVLRHIELEHGSRYAIMTITRYLIIFIGFLVIFHTIGGRWSEIQWLVAALGVGLGFGLQEIVANFISGIILLFERPIRIGDTVTVGEVTGVVSRIQIRATTITDMDRKELLVPNKMFITDKMINWSLSDPISRVVIPVGVAYGSNTILAHQVMVDAVDSLPTILKEPNPSVYFVGFGDSSLDFEVRIFVKSYEERFAITHQIHMELEKRLRENDIEIPFPQRDIHLKY